MIYGLKQCVARWENPGAITFCCRSPEKELIVSAVTVYRYALFPFALVECPATHHTPQHPEVHAQSRIMANLNPRNLSKLVVRSGLRPPQTLGSRMGRRGPRDLA